MRYNICVLPGDGIGPEVVERAVSVLKALPIELEFAYSDIGYETYLKTGNSLPEQTLKKIEDADAALFGAVTTPPNIKGYSSPIIRLRKHFDLYSNVRPIKSLPIQGAIENIDMVIVRENTEDLYSGIERLEDNGDKAVSERIITRKASERIIRYAFRLAKEKGYKKVTVVHKANVLRETCGLFLRCASDIAKEFPDVAVEDLLVDSCAMQLVKDPSRFQVIVTTNMFGDILSDEASMLVGGLGIAYSGNIGESKAVFEPVHGSAPKYAGMDKANPAAAMMAAAMMLDNLGEKQNAKKMQDAILKAIAQGKTTYDLGGSKSSSEFTKAVITNIRC